MAMAPVQQGRPSHLSTPPHRQLLLVLLLGNIRHSFGLSCINEVLLFGDYDHVSRPYSSIPTSTPLPTSTNTSPPQHFTVTTKRGGERECDPKWQGAGKIGSGSEHSVRLLAHDRSSTDVQSGSRRFSPVQPPRLQTSTVCALLGGKMNR